MSQGEIIKILEKEGRLFTNQIINWLRVENEPKTFVTKCLKQLRKFNEVKFICIEPEDKEKKLFRYTNIDEPNKGKWKIIKSELLYLKFPELKLRKEHITRMCYLYYLQ